MNFMKRCVFLVERHTGTSQKLPAEFAEKLETFHCDVLSQRHKYSYQHGQIGNVDQTPLYFEMPATTTVGTKGSSNKVLPKGVVSPNGVIMRTNKKG